VDGWVVIFLQGQDRFLGVVCRGLTIFLANHWASPDPFHQQLLEGFGYFAIINLEAWGSQGKYGFLSVVAKA
jgi:hypothetical protein